MLAVFDFVPRYCPNDAKELNIQLEVNRADYFSHASISCSNGCAFKFQLTTTEAILKASDEVGGDLRHYYERGN